MIVEMKAMSGFFCVVIFKCTLTKTHKRRHLVKPEQNEEGREREDISNEEASLAAQHAHTGV